MRRLSLIFLGLLLCLASTVYPCMASQNSSSRIASVGTINYPRHLTWLHTEGRWIKNENNDTVTPKGACEMSLGYGIYGVTSWDDHSRYFSEHTFDIAQEAGANIIRLGINMKSVLNTEYKSKIKQAVQWCKERGMWVLLDMHGPNDSCGQGEDWMPVLLDPQGTGFYDAWEAWAQEFKNESTVCAFGLMNEPPPAGTNGYTYEQLEAIWRPIVIEAIHKIHTINPNVLIFVDNIQWSSDLHQFIQNPLNEPNVVYCLHRYYHFDWYTNHLPYANAYASGDFETGYNLMKQFYYDKGFKLLDMGYPVIMEEFGCYREDPESPYEPKTADPNYLIQINETYKLFREWQAGYIQFSLGGKVEGYTRHYTMLTDDWSTLNEVGEIWRENL